MSNKKVQKSDAEAVKKKNEKQSVLQEEESAPQQKTETNTVNEKSEPKIDEKVKAFTNQKPQDLAGKKVGNVLIDIDTIDKTFHVGAQDVHVLRQVSLQVKMGDFMIIFGASGSGKSTLLHILLGLEPPSSGKVEFLGDDLFANGDEDYRSAIRKKHIGMVYQQANWIKSLNVSENIAFPLQLLGMEKTMALERAHSLLDRIGLRDWAEYVPTELSSGQQQRISLARALIHNPMIIVADEPTGNLDFESGQEIMTLLKELNKTQDKTVIMVTHDLDYLDFADVAVQVFDGEIVGVYEGEDKKEIAKKIRTKKLGSTPVSSASSFFKDTPTKKQDENSAQAPSQGDDENIPSSSDVEKEKDSKASTKKKK